MSQLIRVARGSLAEKLLKSNRLGSGEVFFDKASKTVYIGDGAESGTAGKHFVLGGLNTLRYKGEISALPATPTYGDMFEVTTGFTVADDGTGHSFEVNKLDFLVYVYNDANIENYDLTTSTKKWVRINNSGGSSVETTFDPTGTNFLPTSVDAQKALVDIDRHKLAFGGNFVSAAACLAGYFYYIANNTTLYIDGTGALVDNPSAVAGVSTDQAYLSKGNLLVVSSDTVENGAAVAIVKKYQLVDLGSNANDISLTTALTRLAGSDAYDEYNATDATTLNLQAVLQTIYTTKADLDKNGKIYIDQLPSTIIGAMDYQGLWTKATALPTAADKSASDTSTENDNDNVLVKGDYWIYSGSTIYITAAGAIVAEGAAGAIRVNNGDWLIVGSNVSGVITWHVLSNESVFKGLIADGVLHEGTPEITDDNRVIEVTSPAGGNTIKVAAPKAMANETETSEIGRIYKAKDTANNFEKSAIIEKTSEVLVEGKDMALQRASSIPDGIAEVFSVSKIVVVPNPQITVDGITYSIGDTIPGFNLTNIGSFLYEATAVGTHTIVGNSDALLTISSLGDDSTVALFDVRPAETLYTFTVDGVVTYSVGDAVPGFTLVLNGDGSYTYTATAPGTHSVAAGLNTSITEITVGTVSGTLAGVKATFTQNTNQTADIILTLPTKSGVIALQQDVADLTENVSEDFLPVKEGTKYVDSPVSRTRTGTVVDGVKVKGKVKLSDGTNEGTLTANSKASTVNALPETDGTILNENSDIDGGYYA